MYFQIIFFVVLKIILFCTQNVLLLFFLTSENRGVTVAAWYLTAGCYME